MGAIINLLLFNDKDKKLTLNDYLSKINDIKDIESFKSIFKKGFLIINEKNSIIHVINIIENAEIINGAAVINCNGVTITKNSVRYITSKNLYIRLFSLVSYKFITEEMYNSYMALAQKFCDEVNDLFNVTKDFYSETEFEEIKSPIPIECKEDYFTVSESFLEERYPNKTFGEIIDDMTIQYNAKYVENQKAIKHNKKFVNQVILTEIGLHFIYDVADDARLNGYSIEFRNNSVSYYSYIFTYIQKAKILNDNAIYTKIVKLFREKLEKDLFKNLLLFLNLN